jgi:NAD(P)-dependent dehydrogenase (short-subunit alcohol dehydrogenase family)
VLSACDFGGADGVSGRWVGTAAFEADTILAAHNAHVVADYETEFTFVLTDDEGLITGQLAARTTGYRIVREAGQPADTLRFDDATPVVHDVFGTYLDPVLEVDLDYWRRMFSVNVDGALLMVQAFAPLMIEAGWGRIVNQTSVAAYGASGAYSATKLALISLTMSQAVELGPHGITVNAIAPGPILTEATLVTVPQERLDRMQAGMPIKRQAQPSDLLSALRFLCSEDSGWVTAETVVVDGGITRRV